jgi:hypothetical protein
LISSASYDIKIQGVFIFVIVVINNKIDSLLGPSGTFTGYALLIFGAIWAYSNITGLIFIAIGMFMAFTFDGTIIDFNSRKIKSYTCLFGLSKVGKWHSVNKFSKFIIYKSNRSYTAYSRANIPLTVKNSDVRLAFLNDDGSLKITINKFNSFETARKEMNKLITDLNISELKEWVK